MIEPTIGRVVWFTPGTNSNAFTDHGGQPCAAMITYVWGSRMVNLVVFDHNGLPHSKTSVTLIQDDDTKNELGHYCEWMPYQIGQAKKNA